MFLYIHCFSDARVCTCILCTHVGFCLCMYTRAKRLCMGVLCMQVRPCFAVSVRFAVFVCASLVCTAVCVHAHTRFARVCV